MRRVISGIFITACLVLLFLSGCKDNTQVNETIIGSGKIISQSRILNECTGINAQSVANIILRQSTIQSITVEADDNIINDVTTTVENGILVTGLKGGSYSNIKLTIYVTLKSINSLIINGAGNITTDTPVNCDVLSCIINGAGNIKLLGTANVLNSTVNGVGNISADSFVTKKCVAIVSGTGNATVNVTDELQATISGVGSIFYYGNPAIVKTTVTGTGVVTKK